MPYPLNVTTSGVSVIELTNAILQGKLTELGDSSDRQAQVSEHGFIYSTIASTENTLLLEAHGVQKTNLGTKHTTGQFSNRLIDLDECTTYYYRAFAVNDIGTNFSEVRSFSPRNQHATFSLSGATEGEQSGLICPGGTHTYSVPLSNTHSYNLTVNIASNVLDNFVIYEGTTTNEIYIQPGPFSVTVGGGGINNPITNTFYGTNSGRRYLVLPLKTVNHRLVISNSRAGIEDYTLTLGEETNTSGGRPIGRLLVGDTLMGFFSNNEPELYWAHLLANSKLFVTIPGVVSGNNCGVLSSTGTDISVIYAISGPRVSLDAFATSVNYRYMIVRILNNDSNFDYRGCQFRFRNQ